MIAIHILYTFSQSHGRDKAVSAVGSATNVSKWEVLNTLPRVDVNKYLKIPLKTWNEAHNAITSFHVYETLKWEWADRKMYIKSFVYIKKGQAVELHENSTRKFWNGFQFNKSIFDGLSDCSLSVNIQHRIGIKLNSIQSKVKFNVGNWRNNSSF